MNHVKDKETTADAFVVMVVIARRIMRKLLAVECEKKVAVMKTEGRSEFDLDEMKGKHAHK